MTASKNLSEKAALLARDDAEFASGTRRIAMAGSEDVAQAILLEIDTSVLPVELTFTSGETTMVLRAGSRRLQSIKSISGAENADNVVSAGLSRDDEDAAKAAIDLIRKFADQADDLFVRPELISQSSVATEGGLSGHFLAEHLLTKAKDDDRPALVQFLEDASGAIVASIYLQNGEIAAESGSDDDLKPLHTCLETQLLEFDKKRTEVCPNHTDPSFTYLLDTISKGTSIGVLIVGQDICIVSFKTESVGDVQSTWATLPV